MIPELVVACSVGALIWIVGFAASVHWLSTNALRPHFSPASYLIAALWPIWFMPVLIWIAASERES